VALPVQGSGQRQSTDLRVLVWSYILFIINNYGELMMNTNQKKHDTQLECLSRTDLKVAAAQAHTEDLPIIQGMADFRSMPVYERIKKNVPSGFVTDVIKTCRKGGMSSSDFPSKALGRNAGDARDALSRYTSRKNKMSIDLLKSVILNAQENGWIDKPPPSDMPPHPNDLGWSAPSKMMRESLKKWRPYFGPSTFSVWRDRLRAFEACVVIAQDNKNPRKKNRAFTLENVRQAALVDLDFMPERMHNIALARTISQKVRRAKENLTRSKGDDFSDWYWVMFSSESDAQNVIHIRRIPSMF